MNSEQLKAKIRECTSCGLHRTSNGPIPFWGRRSPIMVIGEAPGRREDEGGRPFVGPAGQFLWQELAKVGIKEEEVFMANAVCCLPERTPAETEIRACRTNLWRQIKFCNPNHILALGNTANQSMGQKDGIRTLRGEWYMLRWFTETPGIAHPIPVFPTYHPSAVLRNGVLTRQWREDLHAFAREATSNWEA